MKYETEVVEIEKIEKKLHSELKKYLSWCLILGIPVLIFSSNYAKGEYLPFACFVVLYSVLLVSQVFNKIKKVLIKERQ